MALGEPWLPPRERWRPWVWVVLAVGSGGLAAACALFGWQTGRAGAVDGPIREGMQAMGALMIALAAGLGTAYAVHGLAFSRGRRAALDWEPTTRTLAVAPVAVVLAMAAGTAWTLASTARANTALGGVIAQAAVQEGNPRRVSTAPIPGSHDAVRIAGSCGRVPGSGFTLDQGGVVLACEAPDRVSRVHTLTRHAAARAEDVGWVAWLCTERRPSGWSYSRSPFSTPRSVDVERVSLVVRDLEGGTVGVRGVAEPVPPRSTRLAQPVYRLDPYDVATWVDGCLAAR